MQQLCSFILTFIRPQKAKFQRLLFAESYIIEIFAIRSATCVPFSSAHNIIHLTWCRDHRLWTRDKCKTILFTDESRFCLNANTWRFFIWRKPEIHYIFSNFWERDHYNNSSLMACEDIMLDGLKSFPLFGKRLRTSVRCRNAILVHYDCLFIDIFYLISCAPRKSSSGRQISRKWEYYLDRLSNQMSRLKHCSVCLGRTIWTWFFPPRTSKDVKTALLKDWY